MNKTALFVVSMLVLQVLAPEPPSDIRQWHIDFDLSLGKGSPGYKKKFQKQQNQHKLNYLRRLYKKNNLSKVKYQETAKIPRIIHQIWVGDRPRPVAYDRLIETWIKYNPGWEYRLWTNEEVKKLKLYNQEFYDNADIPAEKANILRYEILNQFGGLYCDIDFECLQSFEPLIHCYDFFTGLEPLDSSHMLNNALIACSPHHPIIRYCIKNMKNHMHKSSRLYRNGVGHFTRCFVALADKVPGVTIAFPPSYFYPLPILYDIKKSVIKCLRPESFAVHYWAGEHGTRRPKLGFKNKAAR